MNLLEITHIILWLKYSTIVYIHAFKCVRNSIYKVSNTHLSECKGTRKGIHKAKVGHRHGVDFSMGYWTEIKNNSVIKLHFLFCTLSVTAALTFRPTISFPWFCVTSLHWVALFMFYFLQGLTCQTYQAVLFAYLQYTVFIWARDIFWKAFWNQFVSVLLDCAR